MSTQQTGKRDHSTNQLGLPPPLPELELTDGDRVVGWVRGNTVGFRGFANEEEAAHAAWVAYRTLTRRLARRHRTRPVPIDTEPLAIHRRGEHEVIVAGTRDVATLVRFNTGDRNGTGSVGFEIGIHGEADELMVRAKAYAMYRTLRKSGIRWELWRRMPPAPPLRTASAVRTVAEAPSAPAFVGTPEQRRLALAVLSIALLALAFFVGEGLRMALSVAGLVGLFGLRLTTKSGQWRPLGFRRSDREWSLPAVTLARHSRQDERAPYRRHAAPNTDATFVMEKI